MSRERKLKPRCSGKVITCFPSSSPEPFWWLNARGRDSVAVAVRVGNGIEGFVGQDVLNCPDGKRGTHAGLVLDLGSGTMAPLLSSKSARRLFLLKLTSARACVKFGVSEL